MAKDLTRIDAEVCDEDVTQWRFDGQNVKWIPKLWGRCKTCWSRESPPVAGGRYERLGPKRVRSAENLLKPVVKSHSGSKTPQMNPIHPLPFPTSIYYIGPERKLELSQSNGGAPVYAHVG